MTRGYFAVRWLAAITLALPLAAQSALDAQQRGATSNQPRAQTPKPTATAPATVQTSQSLCEDKSYQKACKSYEELVQAGDDGVKPHFLAVPGSIAFVCFRQGEDVFLVIELNGPCCWKIKDPDLVNKIEESKNALGWARAFENGIGGSVMMPLTSFKGTWTRLAKILPSHFQADSVNLAGASDQQSVWADESQFAASVRYENRFGKNIDYRLVIQRSTGRFAETYKEESAQLPFSESQGRCSRILSR
jgi:hypothetical protein